MENALNGNEVSNFNSSNVDAFWYQEPDIYVRFRDQSVYVYYGCGEEIMVAFVGASSKGKFVHNILKFFRYKKVG